MLLTGATGFVGRYLALELLEQMEQVGGTLICLVRAGSDDEARRRLRGDVRQRRRRTVAALRRTGRRASGRHRGRQGRSRPGPGPQTWQLLADTVDLIVDSAAVVNAVLPYSELFGPNVVGTAELIRLALSTRLQSVTRSCRLPPSAHRSSRRLSPRTPTSGSSAPPAPSTDGLAVGYGNSKWAGEVLLREANDLCGLPVAVFRCDMILADATYAGQLNLRTRSPGWR